MAMLMLLFVAAAVGLVAGAAGYVLGRSSAVPPGASPAECNDI